MIGTQLGPYRVIEQLGAGGMGEVWLANDDRLQRRVAIKVLPAEFAADPERLARFEQESRAAAGLNHPNIAAVFDVGHQDSVYYFVQELLEGRTLRELIDAGPVSRAKALAIGAQIAEALDAAHRAGVVHRDLKPGNVFVSDAGHAKVLDFGLAKLTEPTVSVGGSGSGRAAESPTALGTMAGAVMGTAGYMAPEQVRGDEIDGRADLFAAGCVLCELLTGERAFDGETLIDTLHAITREEPRQLDGADGRLDPDMRWILSKCLEKERDLRYQHAADLAVDLRRLAAGPGPAMAVEQALTAGTTAPAPGSRAARLPWLVAGAALLLAAFLGYRTATTTTDSQVVRLTIPASFPQSVTSRYHAVSPDGRLLAYRLDAVTERLAIQATDSFEPRPILGSEGAVAPFFSQDGRYLAFFAQGKLWSVDVAGGTPREICDVSTNNSNGVWSGDEIYFIQWATGTGVFRVDASGGVAEEVIPRPADAGNIHRPRPLPDGQGLVLESARVLGTQGASRVFFFDGRDPVWVDRPQASYLRDGTALYVEGGRLFRAEFDAATYQIEGQPTPFMDGVLDYDVSDTGTIAYRWGNPERVFSFARVDRDGNVSPVDEFDSQYSRPQISPDGNLIMAAGVDAPGLFLWDAARGARRQFSASGLYPQWEPDGQSVILMTAIGGTYEIRRQYLDASIEPEVLHTREISVWPTDVSPDGSMLLYYEIAQETERDIWMLPLDGSGGPEPFLVTAASERSAVFSPDGRWVAYMSDVTGANAVYVRPAPGRRGVEVIVSPEGGTQPRWSPDGSELYYRLEDGIWEVPVRAEPSFSVGEPELLFTGRFTVEEGGRNQEYDVFPDGDFLMTYAPEQFDELRVVLEWFEEFE